MQYDRLNGARLIENRPLVNGRNFIIIHATVSYYDNILFLALSTPARRASVATFSRPTRAPPAPLVSYTFCNNNNSNNNIQIPVSAVRHRVTRSTYGRARYYATVYARALNVSEFPGTVRDVRNGSRFRRERGGDDFGCALKPAGVRSEGYRPLVCRLEFLAVRVVLTHGRTDPNRPESNT